jgi:hypothetical protein
MSSGQYLLPIEFIALLAFVFLPPALVAWLIQAVILRRGSFFANRAYARVACVYLAPPLLALIVLETIHFTAPAGWGEWLGLRDFRLGDHSYPVWPFGFFLVPAIGAGIAWAVRLKQSA